MRNFSLRELSTTRWLVCPTERKRPSSLKSNKRNHDQIQNRFRWYVKKRKSISNKAIKETWNTKKIVSIDNHWCSKTYCSSVSRFNPDIILDLHKRVETTQPRHDVVCTREISMGSMCSTSSTYAREPSLEKPSISRNSFAHSDSVLCLTSGPNQDETLSCSSDRVHHFSSGPNPNLRFLCSQLFYSTGTRWRLSISGSTLTVSIGFLFFYVPLEGSSHKCDLVISSVPGHLLRL